MKRTRQRYDRSFKISVVADVEFLVYSTSWKFDANVLI